MGSINFGPDPIGATPLGTEELEGLKLSYIASREQLNVAEQLNISNADNWFRKTKKKPEEVLTMNFLIELHRKMFGDVWNWAGKWRNKQTNIGVYYEQIQAQTLDTIKDANYWHDNKSFMPIEISVRLHHRLVKVHPFPNGNGRVTRAIADYYLISINKQPLTWGSKNLSNETKIRSTYIKALEEADLTENYEPLINFASS